MKRLYSNISQVLALAALGCSEADTIAPDAAAAEDVGTVRQSLSAPTKICSASISYWTPGDLKWHGFRDTLEVSDNFSIASCQSWALSVLGNSESISHYQIGCLFPSGFSTGAPSSLLQLAPKPPSNCGW